DRLENVLHVMHTGPHEVELRGHEFRVQFGELRRNHVFPWSRRRFSPHDTAQEPAHAEGDFSSRKVSIAWPVSCSVWFDKPRLSLSSITPSTAPSFRPAGAAGQQIVDL